MENNQYVQKVLESSENGVTVLIDREVSWSEAFRILRKRRLKEIIFIEAKECTQLNSEKQ